MSQLSIIAVAPALAHSQQGHPENPKRISAIANLLDNSGLLADLRPVTPTTALISQLQAVHTPELIEQVRVASNWGGGNLDADTYTTAQSYELARIAAGTTARCADLIATGKATNGISIVRPPGHHAESSRVGGFCLFNNIAIAARQAQRHPNIERVAIIDFDVHHGNGTQEIFYADPSVLFISTHLYHYFFYPGTGTADEIGYGEGRLITMNVPFGPGVGDWAYAQAMKRLIRPKVAWFQPDMILVSAGFDAHWIDPLASASLTLSGYAELARAIVELANELCDGRILFVLEGGYHNDALSYGVLNLIYALMGKDEIIDPLGPAPNPEVNSDRLVGLLQELHLLY